MHPILFQWGPITVYSYGVLVATGVLLGLWVARWQAPRAGTNPDLVWNVGIYMVLSALVVAKLWLISLYAGYYWAHPREIFALTTLQSGGTFYGGVLGAFLMLGFYKFVKKVRLLPLMDCYGLGLPLGHAIGRLGCFAAGCCYGKPTWLPWGVTYTNAKAAELVGTPLNIAVHPTQIYESIAEFANFLLILWLGGRQRFTGELVAVYLMLYGVERGLFEFLRGDPDRTLMFHGAVSLMQIVSVGMIIFGASIWYRESKVSRHVSAHASR